MTPLWQTPRAGLLWLLIAQIAIAGGLWAVLPLWVVVLLGVSCLWRLQVYRGAWNFPGSLPKLLMVAACGAGLLLSFDRMTGLEPLASLLVCASAFKLLEMHRRRDGLILVFACYFSATIQLLFEQTIPVAVYTLFCFVLVTAALTGIYQSTNYSLGDNGSWAPLRRSTSLVAQSLPLMVVLFLVLPRLPAFWAVPGQQATTGVSGEMSPGDISQLGKNGGLAFRVSFDGPLPQPQEFYWRGPVLTHFDGRRWSQLQPVSYRDGPHIDWHGQQPASWRQRVGYFGNTFDYTVILEATQQPWLFALMAPQRYSDEAGLTREMRLVRQRPVHHKIQYSVTSSSRYRFFADGLHPRQRRQVLQLPEGYNPRAISLAKRWRSESLSAQSYIERVLDWYNREFTYTLQPPALGRHSVDEFLWQSQQGFCEHFASSFVFLMRAGGIPARVVTGYQGAERHPEGYFLVHQYDAHAWAEVWLPEQGWVRVDPTAAVAPERIESGFESYFQQRETFLEDSPFSLARFRHIDWINKLRLKLDSLDYYWSKWVLGYEGHQHSFLKSLLGNVSWQRIGLLLLCSGAFVVLCIALWLWRGKLAARRADPLDRYFARLCAKTAGAGWPRLTGEGPMAYRERLQNSGFTENAGIAENVISALLLYEKIRYAENRECLAAFRREVNAL